MGCAVRDGCGLRVAPRVGMGCGHGVSGAVDMVARIFFAFFVSGSSFTSVALTWASSFSEAVVLRLCFLESMCESRPADDEKRCLQTAQ